MAARPVSTEWISCLVIRTPGDLFRLAWSHGGSVNRALEPISRASYQSLLSNHGFKFSRSSAQEDPAHAHVQQHLSGLTQAFVILAQTTIATKPRQPPFHHPAAWQNMKAGGDLRRLPTGRNPNTTDPGPPMLDDLQHPTKFRLEPLLEPLIMRVGPQQPNVRKQPP